MRPSRSNGSISPDRAARSRGGHARATGSVCARDTRRSSSGLPGAWLCRSRCREAEPLQSWRKTYRRRGPVQGCHPNPLVERARSASDNFQPRHTFHALGASCRSCPGTVRPILTTFVTYSGRAAGELGARRARVLGCGWPGSVGTVGEQKCDRECRQGDEPAAFECWVRMARGLVLVRTN